MGIVSRETIGYASSQLLKVLLAQVSSLTHHSTRQPWEAWVGVLMREVYRLPVTSVRYAAGILGGGSKLKA